MSKEFQLFLSQLRKFQGQSRSVFAQESVALLETFTPRQLEKVGFVLCNAAPSAMRKAYPVYEDLPAINTRDTTYD